MKKITILIVLLGIAQITTAQDRWGTQGQYITKNGSPLFLSGANYDISDGWMINLPNLSKESMNADMEALQKIGVNHIRFFPLWTLTQPTKDRLDEKVMKQIDLLVEIAGKHNITMQISPITGWMCGHKFIPPWAGGDLFRDQKIIDGEKFLAKTFATRYRNNPAVLGFDFGNELNVLQWPAATGITPVQMFSWLKQIYPSFKNELPDQLVTNGIGVGYDDNFDIRNIAQTVDFLSPHSYAFFHETSSIDPWLGQRTTFSANFIVNWCKMVGKPVLLQEIGCSETWVPVSKIGPYLRLNYLSTWADGAAGFVWWASHDIDSVALRPRNKELAETFTIQTTNNKPFEDLEYTAGLLTSKNEPKEYAETYAECIKTVNSLGFSWADDLPVCYIIVPDNLNFNDVMHKFITAYALAKQTHFNVKLLYEGLSIPVDADAVFIPGFKLTGKAKDMVQSYLANGGKVYQSYENDFGTAITVGADTVINDQPFWVGEAVGLMEYGMPIIIPGKISFRKTTYNQQARGLVSLRPGSINSTRKLMSNPLFLEQTIGKGTYYYLAYNLEANLAKAYNPWPDTNCELFYSALRPQVPIDIDNKYVELYIKRSGDKSIIMLLNHSEEYQNVTVKSIIPLTLFNFESKDKIGSGKEITMALKPAQVVIAEIQ